VLGVTTSFIMTRRDSAEGIFSGAAGATGDFSIRFA
jgi:hypothetical protein